MKKIIYIAFVAVGLVAVSCSKETIRPISKTGEEVPVWKTAGASTDDTDTDDDGTITDPNNDRDEGSRKRQ